MRVRTIAGGVEVLAPAKLNLFLEILGRRPDGYHEIETLMVAVDLHDTLTFLDDPSGEIRLRCSDPALPTGADNLVVKAAERLREATGCRRGARIDLREGDPRAGRPGAAVRATRRRPWRPWIGSGTCGCPRTGWTPWPRRSAATWRSSAMPPPRSAAAGGSGWSRCR